MTLAKRLSAGVPIRECSFVPGGLWVRDTTSTPLTVRDDPSQWLAPLVRPRVPVAGLDEHRDRREDT